eukprot:CAMPEP_0172791816 /NCGR_PEP_ID=MMETSP1074-20121228/208654_1 /TAXON_ID=2916 /ORGANISM="Ceratium fusus, Strain PA161109" /LENGTH=255 /DNA_ID=CAMNT_0013628877 /DNA_START=117 /DNA_END=886 /DNA_ORIENTATION=+
MRQDAEHWHAVATQAVQPVSATLCLQHLLRSEAVVHYLYFLGYMPPMELRNLTAMKELIGGLDQSRLLLAQPGYCSQHGLRHALQLVGPSSPQQAEVVAASNGQYLWMCSNHSSGWLWPLVSAAATLVAAALGDAVAGFAAAAAAAAAAAWLQNLKLSPEAADNIQRFVFSLWHSSEAMQQLPCPCRNQFHNIFSFRALSADVFLAHNARSFGGQVKSATQLSCSQIASATGTGGITLHFAQRLSSSARAGTPRE